MCLTPRIHYIFIPLQRKKSQFSDVLRLKNKSDIVVWVPLSGRQREMYPKTKHCRKVFYFMIHRYSNYLADKALQLTLQRSNYPVEAINYLKTLCRHPLLVEAARITKLGSNKSGLLMVEYFVIRGVGASALDIDALAASIGNMKLHSTISATSLYCSQDDDEAYQNSGRNSVFDIVQKYPSVDDLLHVYLVIRNCKKLL